MEFVESTFVEKRLKKMSTQQLFKKVEENQFNLEEKKIAMSILESRAAMISGEGIISNSEDDLNAGEISVEEITSAVDEVYATEDPAMIKGLTATFKRSVDNYSELDQDERAAIIKYVENMKNPEKKGKPAAKKDVKEKGESKSKAIRTLLRQGKSVSEISKELGIRYNFVYNVRRKFLDIQKG